MMMPQLVQALALVLEPTPQLEVQATAVQAAAQQLKRLNVPWRRTSTAWLLRPTQLCWRQDKIRRL